MLNLITSAYAQDAIQTAAKQASPWSSLIPLVLIMVVFYFLLIRPQQKKMKDHQLLVQGVVKGDKIMTNGGIFGEVVGLEEEGNIVKLLIAENVIIKVRKDMVSDVINKPAKEAEIQASVQQAKKSTERNTKKATKK